MSEALQELVKTFERHSIQAEKHNKELLEKFIENNPDSPIPSHFKESFDLPSALGTIYKEILSIKEKIV